jgi:hypothetical protein
MTKKQLARQAAYRIKKARLTKKQRHKAERRTAMAAEAKAWLKNVTV